LRLGFTTEARVLAISAALNATRHGCQPMPRKSTNKDANLVEATTALFTCGRTTTPNRRKKKDSRIMENLISQNYAKPVKKEFASYEHT
jgi:ribosomal protein L17